MCWQCLMVHVPYYLGVYQLACILTFYSLSLALFSIAWFLCFWGCGCVYHTHSVSSDEASNAMVKGWSLRGWPYMLLPLVKPGAGAEWKQKTASN